MNKWTAAFVQRLREHGWIDGRTVTIEFRWAELSRFRQRNASFILQQIPQH
jgi:hypothetical protein